jgi:glycosyltransferase involved in cell wall biosynthesis
MLWKAIESVVAQTLADWELIIVDDGSTDCTERLVEEFRDERIRLVRQKNRGPSAARNRGLEAATAPLIGYLDSDNTWRPHFLATMQERIDADARSDDVLWYCGAHVRFWERSSDGTWSLAREFREPSRQYELDDVWALHGADTNCMVHRRGLADEIDGWDEKCQWLEDWDFFLRSSLAYPNGIRWIPEILVDYRQVHGTGADGICAEAREDGAAERTARQYLLDK